MSKKSNGNYTIVIRVAYDVSSINDDLDVFLEKEVERAIQNGMLSPSGGEIVDEYSMEVSDRAPLHHRQF